MISSLNTTFAPTCRKKKIIFRILNKYNNNREILIIRIVVGSHPICPKTMTRVLVRDFLLEKTRFIFNYTYPESYF